MAKVYILCGKIAVGKTTYAEEIKKREKAVILSHDELMLNLFDACLGSKHDEVVARCSNYFHSLAEQLIGIGINVILDFGYWKREEREKAKNYFKERNIEVEIHYVTIEEKRRLQQLDERNRALQGSASRVYIIGESLRERLDTKFEEPEVSEVDQYIIR